MSEASFWDYLRQFLPSGMHYDRIESSTSPGHPDIRYTLDGVSGTIELKSAKKKNLKKRKPFSGGNDGLRQSQIDWMEREQDAGGSVWLIAEVGADVYFLNGCLYWGDFNDLDVDDLLRLSRLHWVKKDGFPVQSFLTALVNKE